MILVLGSLWKLLPPCEAEPSAHHHHHRRGRVHRRRLRAELRRSAASHPGRILQCRKMASKGRRPLSEAMRMCSAQAREQDLLCPDEKDTDSHVIALGPHRDARSREMGDRSALDAVPACGGLRLAEPIPSEMAWRRLQSPCALRPSTAPGRVPH
ncbi:hypothetical protein HDV57DRAFT_497974 [Trichoderma longibrachiatum]